jgi:glycosyltransferase involved in cell wall biosynthesis
MKEAVSLGYPKDRIFIVSHGVDERFLSRTKRRKGGAFKVGFIGALNVRKNLSMAINAFKRASSSHMQLEIWGRQILEYENLRLLASGDRRIKFMGFAPEGRLVDIYDSFDVFVFPSLYEGFGLPIIEAQARGLPVIIYKHAKIPEEVGRYCFKAEDEDHMSRIITKLCANGYDEKARKRATKYARGYTRRKEALATLQVYKKIYSR